MNIWDFDVGDEVIYKYLCIPCKAVVLKVFEYDLYLLWIEDDGRRHVEIIRFPLEEGVTIEKTGVKYCLSSLWIKEMINGAVRK